MPDLKQPQINSTIISGRLTADPEVKAVGQNETEVCNVTLATDDGYGDKKKSIFLDCTCWGKTAEMVGKLHKGSPVVFQGRLRMEEWVDNKTGADRRKISLTVNRMDGLAWENKEKPEPGTTREDPPF